MGFRTAIKGVSRKLQGEEIDRGRESDVFRGVVRALAAGKMRIKEDQKNLYGLTEPTVSSDTQGWYFTCKLVQRPA